MTTAPKTKQARTRAKPEDGEEAKSFSTYVREHPAAFIAGGIVLGVVVGALFPKKAGGAAAKRALALAATAGELSLVASRHARQSAEKAAHEAKELYDRDSVIVREKAGQFASVAREAGQRVVERATDLASRLKH
jgi:hypothetical protein